MPPINSLTSFLLRISIGFMGLYLLLSVVLKDQWFAKEYPKYSGNPSTNARECRSLFEIPKPQNILAANKEEWYASLAGKLPSLLPEDNSSAFINTTRLQLMGGFTPFTSCQVHQYNRAEVGECGISRRTSGSTTWLAFVGDSQMRNKLLSFLSITPHDFEYKYFVGSVEVTRKLFMNYLASHDVRPPAFDLIGYGPSLRKVNPWKLHHNTPSSYGEITNDPGIHESFHIEKELKEPYDLRVSFVWAPFGSILDLEQFPELDQDKLKTMKTLHKWNASKHIPDAIVLGYSMWFLLMKSFGEELCAFTNLDYSTRPLLEPLRTLTSRTYVLLWGQSRYRWFEYENENKGDNKKVWKTHSYYNQFSGNIPMIDDWLWRIIQSTGAWRWDSVIPFNLANIKECYALYKQNMTQKILYTSNWWNCKNDFHTSFETNVDELQLLLNLLCNPFVIHPSSHNNYCCT